MKYFILRFGNLLECVNATVGMVVSLALVSALLRAATGGQG